MRTLVGRAGYLAVLFGPLALFGYVVVRACLGNWKLLAGWLLLSTLSAAWFFFAARRAIEVDDECNAYMVCRTAAAERARASGRPLRGDNV